MFEKEAKEYRKDLKSKFFLTTILQRVLLKWLNRDCATERKKELENICGL